MTDEKTVELNVLYLGRRVDVKRNLGARIATLDQIKKCRTEYHDFPPASLSRAIEDIGSLFSKLSMKSIGGLYTVKGIIDNDGIITTIVSSSAEFKRVPNGFDDLSGAWEMMDQAAVAENRSKIAENNAVKNSLLRGIVNELKPHYKACPAGYRTGFRVWLLNELDKP